jgi:7-cyano-7-deazaguanine synthase
METNKKYVVLSLSGGMDSSTLLLRLLSEGYECVCLSFDYGQKHKVELERAKELVEYVNGHSQKAEQDQLGTITVTGENFPLVKHQIIKIDGLSQLLNSTLVEGGSDVPEGHYEDSNMVKTVVENRNKIFSSIIQSVALATANKNNTSCVIAMGIHAGDHLIYKDCRAEFRDADYKAFLEGNENGERVQYYTPYLNTDKFGILQDGVKCCEQLGLDFDEVYKRTNTSYKPIKYTTSRCIMTDEGPKMEFGFKWYSDFKSASSVERIEAFIKLGKPDPVEYADETGPVTWEVAKQHVEQILQQNG